MLFLKFTSTMTIPHPPPPHFEYFLVLAVLLKFLNPSQKFFNTPKISHATLPKKSQPLPKKSQPLPKKSQTLLKKMSTPPEKISTPPEKM